jgi:hypothetical protein
MKSAGIIVGLILLSLAGPNLAVAQTPAPPSPERMAAARELVAAMRLDALAMRGLNAILPAILQNLRPAFLQGRPKSVEMAFDAMVPAVIETVNSRAGEFTDQLAAIYGQAYEVDEMRQITAFYRSPVGQKVLEKMPAIDQQSMAAGQAFMRKLQDEIRDEIAGEFRKWGLDPEARP